jgi:transposase-like protein
MRKTKAFHKTRLKIVGEALAGVKTGVLARKYGIHPETIRNWIRKYRDEVGPDNIPSTDEQILELKRLQDIEEKYHKAMKLLGEKELEIEVLRELLKKTNPDYAKDLKPPTSS